MRKEGRARRFAIPRCGQRRHWFTYYGAVGSYAPVCQHCGAPNPYLSDREIDELNPVEFDRWTNAKQRLEATHD